MQYFIRHALFLLLLFVCSCANADSGALPTSRMPQPVATLRPTLAASSAPATDQLDDSSPDTGWVTGDVGIELRKLRLELDDRTAAISVARLDPARVRLRVGYTPGAPQSLTSWAKQTRPLLIANGGFFDETFHATALLVSDGAQYGQSYEGFGGMLTVGAGGEIDIQALRDQPYAAGQPFEQAMQSFPMLVFPGGVESGVQWEETRDRRTAIAIDRDGRLLVVVCPQSSFSLNEFATWLRESDLDIDRALNLDGGASTGLYVDAGAAQERIEAFSRLPIVLFAEARV